MMSAFDHVKWDVYFYNVCKVVASNSECLSRKIGAIIVRDHSIIGTGYNGPPRGVPHCPQRYCNDGLVVREIKDYIAQQIALDSEKGQLLVGTLEGYTNGSIPIEQCPRKFLGYESGKGLHLCLAGHAERNALINSARMGIAVEGTIMYMSCNIPCKDCLIEIINAGVLELVVTDLGYYDEASQFLVEKSGLFIRTYNPGVVK